MLHHWWVCWHLVGSGTAGSAKLEQCKQSHGQCQGYGYGQSGMVASLVEDPYKEAG
jgi:hypothetical protein